MASLFGLMVANILAYGKVESSTALALTLARTVFRSKANGKTEGRCVGLVKKAVWTIKQMEST
jgi:hypothetical protein